MADYVDIYASTDSGHRDGLFEGNPAGHAFLEDDSNSGAGIPDDWTAEPQLTATKRGALVVIVYNTTIEIAICGPEEAPSAVAYVRGRVPTSGIGAYSSYAEGGRNRVFIRRGL